MTKTVQVRSWAYLNESGKDINIDKPQKEDDRRLLLSLFDSLNNLYETLSRLHYAMERKIMERIECRKGKNETK
jgi:hypothetical protein